MIGKCLCGTIQFKITGVVPNLYQCHCSLCRKQSGSSSNAATLIHENNFSWLSGEDRISKYKMEDGFTSHFCPTCGSPVPNRLRETDKFWIPAGLLAGEIDSQIVVHLHTKSKASWEKILNKGKQYDEMPDFETLNKLLQVTA